MSNYPFLTRRILYVFNSDDTLGAIHTHHERKHNKRGRSVATRRVLLKLGKYTIVLDHWLANPWA